MKAVILAGGKGTRLASLTKDIPKPMVPLAGKPILQYQVELCSRYNLDEVILIVNHLGEVIEDHFGDGRKYDIPISYHYEGEPLGTVGGIVEIQDQLNDDFLVLYGDVMMDMDLNRLVRFHQQKQSEATLVVHPNDHPYDSDLVEMDEDDRVCAVHPKPHPEGMRYHNMVNAAVYIFSPSIFQHLEKGKKADFGRDIFPRIFSQVRMYAYNTPEYLKDMGTPERKEQVEKDVESGKVERRSLEHTQKAIFLDRDGVLNYDTDLIHRPEDLELYDFTADAIKKINRSDYLSVITTNQSVVARNLTTIEGLREIHKKMETELGNMGAKLDDIRFCPHHPHGGFPEENPKYKIDCHCRKPKPGMLIDAANRFHINLQESWMIGDSERDSLAAKAAGCTSVGVMTGHGHKRAGIQPEYLFANLAEAVDFILSDPYQSSALEVWKLLNNSSGKPFVINIGGNSRSGKSNFATYLQKFLESKERSVMRINLDDWIRPREERQQKDEVFYNFNMEKLEEDVQRILSGESRSLKTYRPHKEQPELRKTYSYQSEDIVIIEGVVALSGDRLLQKTDLTIFMKIEEQRLKQRFETYYQWKEYSQEEMEALWENRLENEFRLIARDEKKADMVLTSA